MPLVNEDGERIKQSRWVSRSDVPRYDKRVLEAFGDVYVEADGWRNGARLAKRGR